MTNSRHIAVYYDEKDYASICLNIVVEMTRRDKRITLPYGSVIFARH